MADRNIPMEIITWMKSFYLENKKMPVLQDIAIALNISVYKVQESLKILVSQGFMKLNYNKYSFSDSVWDELTTPKAPEAVPENLPVLPKKSPEEDPPVKVLTFNMDWIITAIRIAFLVIAFFASVLSAFYTYKWAVKYNPVPIALLLSLTVVFFSVIAFEVVLLFWNNVKRVPDKKGIIKMKRPQAGLAILFFVVWLIAMAFSMTSTVAGLYNRRVDVQQEALQKNSAGIYKEIQWKLYNKSGTADETALSDKTDEYRIFKKAWLKSDQSATNRQYRDMKRTEKEMQIIQTSIGITTKQQLSFITKQTNPGVTMENSIIIPTFYEWLSKIFKGASSDLIEFVLSLFPALFIDIIAPLALAVSMFLKAPNKKEEN